MKLSALRSKIEAKRATIARLDGRIGELMSQRADTEDQLAGLLRKQAAMKPEKQPGAIAREEGRAL